MVNLEIINLLKSQYPQTYWPSDPELYQIYLYLLREWPQINSHTQIRLTNTLNVYIERPYPIRIAESMVWVKRSGLKWLHQLLQQRAPDDPDQRWQYQKNVWSIPFRTPRYWFWRTIGRIFKRKDWIQRGMEQTYSPVVPAVNVDRTILELQQFGWQIRPAEYGYPAQNVYIACAYFPADDILYVYRH